MKRKIWLVLLVMAGVIIYSLAHANGNTVEAGKYKAYSGSLPEFNQEIMFSADGTGEMFSETDTTPLLWTLKNNTLRLMLCPGVHFYKPDSILLAENDSMSGIFVYQKDRLSIPQALNLNAHDFIKADYTFTVEKTGIDSLLLTNTTSDTEIKIHRLYSSTEKVDAPLENQGFSIMGLLRGLLGMVVLLFIAWLFSTNRKAVSWRVVLIGLAIQGGLAISILKVSFVKTFFEFVGQVFVKILQFSQDGAEFLLGGLMDSETYGYIFAFQILPTIIFFSALTSVLFYAGIIQKVVYGLAWLLTKALKISGAESLSVAGNIFIGQTESPLMIKAYLPGMNKSEILLVMIGGMATVAGGVLAAYIGFLGGDDPAMRLLFAKHLLAASVMAAPGAIVV
ncbi:MAG: hypothetical protein PF590_07075, partial [Candidatus Delongbacteria bacterium]|nr:hypothetical protein [Candidatus Delongbacteria bacterium]